MTSLTFYGGVNEIGGNKFLLKNKETKIFLDFGKSFSLENQYFDFPLLQPFYIPDLKKINAIPKIKGLYRNSETKPDVHGVLITHPHVDHYGYISLLKKDVPVFLGEGTKNIIDIRNEIYKGGWDKKLDHLTFKTFRTGDEKNIKDISFKPFAVDHSVPAAYAFVIYIKDKVLVYTGDLRMHGTMKHLTENFLENAKKEEVDILLCEGTNIKPEDEDVFIRYFEQLFRKRMGKTAPKRIHKHCETEEQVEAEMKNIIKDMEGLVIVETSPADVDRIRTVWKVAKATGRKLIIDSRQAYLVYECVKRDRKIKDLPCPKDSFVYLQRMKDRNAEDEGTETYKRFRYKFQQNLIEECEPNVIWGSNGREKIRKETDDYILCTDNATQKLLELKDEKEFNCNFILSKSEPFTEEMVIDFDKLLHWLALYNIKLYYQIHVSGHCEKKDLKKIVETIDPKVLIPIHTKHPDLFKILTKVKNIKVPEFGGTIEI